MTARRFPFALVLSALPVLAILVGLGTWQVERLAWKEALLAEIAARIAAPPEPIAALDARFTADGDVDYRPVTVTGVFDHGGERHFLATHDGEAGFFVYTPLDTADGRPVFVNRGFVPYDRKERTSRPEGEVAGAVIVTGLARNPLPAKPSRLLPDNDPARNIFFWKDLAGMARAAGRDPAAMRPFFIDAGASPNPGGLPIGGVTLIDLPNNHLQYAVTWYGLALALVAVVAVMVARRLRSDQG